MVQSSVTVARLKTAECRWRTCKVPDSPTNDRVRDLPAVDRLAGAPALAELRDLHGPARVTGAARAVLAEARARLLGGEALPEIPLAELVARRVAVEEAATFPSVFNLTGTVIHTNLGRAPLAEAAIAAMTAAARTPLALEYDLEHGRRGERDAPVEALLRELTGAEAALVVNNNAAAVLLLLNALANRKQVPVSRGELVEIGGSFRVPDIMARAGAKLVEVGTTNRTHARDFEAAIEARTALLMQVHTSNYELRGFTAAVDTAELARIAHAADLPLVVDLGSGTLADLETYGLPHETTPREVLAAGADLVTFSGDKLLGGPQAGLVVGRADLIGKLRRNPMKRALRADKVTLAGLAATLQLYRSPERLAEVLPVLRLLTRPTREIHALAENLAPSLRTALGAAAVEVVAVRSQIGSGALPVDLLDSAALALRPERGGGAALNRLAAAFRRLPRPVIGRLHEGRLLLDLRCLDDPDRFREQLTCLEI
jgi:L-seryl-tRNA(Ser) seleniumtransferase